MPERPWFSRLLFGLAPRFVDTRHVGAVNQAIRIPPEISAGTAGPDGPPFTVFRRVEPIGSPDRTTDHQLVIIAAGEIDLATAPLLQTTLLSAVDEYPRVCCDLGEVTFFSAAGVTALLRAYRHAARGKSLLSVRGASGVTRRILEVTGVERVLGTGSAAHHPDASATGAEPAPADRRIHGGPANITGDATWGAPGRAGHDSHRGSRASR